MTTTVTSSTSYTWWNQAKAQTASVSGATTGSASYAYDANGNLSQVNDSGVGRVVTYQTDSFGQVLSRKETSNGIKGAYRNFFYLEGHGVGDVGNDKLASQTEHAQALAANRSNAMLPSTTNDTSTPTLGGAYGNFEVYQPLNTATVAQTGSTYTVMAGDTLQSVAQTVWGDALQRFGQRKVPSARSGRRISSPALSVCSVAVSLGAHRDGGRKIAQKISHRFCRTGKGG